VGAIPSYHSEYLKGLFLGYIQQIFGLFGSIPKNVSCFILLAFGVVVVTILFDSIGVGSIPTRPANFKYYKLGIGAAWCGHYTVNVETRWVRFPLCSPNLCPVNLVRKCHPYKVEMKV